MKNLLKYVFIAVLLINLCACENKDLQMAGKKANILSGAYVKNMKAGKTTPAEDQAHILSMDAEIYAADSAINGSDEALATRKLVDPSFVAPVSGSTVQSSVNSEQVNTTTSAKPATKGK